MLGIGTGSIILPQVQTSALGMPLLQGPDGAMNLLSNIQVGVAARSSKQFKNSAAVHGCHDTKCALRASVMSILKAFSFQVTQENRKLL